MQFKQSGSRTQILAYEGYDKEAKRAIVKMIGSFGQYDSREDIKTKRELTADEETELLSYLDSIRQSRAERSAQVALSYIRSSIDHATKALSDGVVPDDADADWVERTYASIDAFTAAMRKAGHKRPPKPPKKLSDSAQADLLGN